MIPVVLIIRALLKGNFTCLFAEVLLPKTSSPGNVSLPSRLCLYYALPSLKALQ